MVIATLTKKKRRATMLGTPFPCISKSALYNRKPQSVDHKLSGHC